VLPKEASIDSSILPQRIGGNPKFLKTTVFLECACLKEVEQEGFFRIKSGYGTTLMLTRQAEFLEMTYEWKYDSFERKAVLQRVSPQYRKIFEIPWEKSFAGESMPLGAITLFSLYEAQKETNRQRIASYTIGLRIEDRQQRVLEQLGWEF
jgi:hypothetical protein